MRRIARAIGLEGAFLVVGTVLLAIGSSFVNPIGPWLVLGVAALVVGFILARPAPRPPAAPPETFAEVDYE
jgi:hypothetical protein